MIIYYKASENQNGDGEKRRKITLNMKPIPNFMRGKTRFV
jgi:hypothetical protein